jgi:hypothetical protein
MQSRLSCTMMMADLNGHLDLMIKMRAFSEGAVE